MRLNQTGQPNARPLAPVIELRPPSHSPVTPRCNIVTLPVIGRNRSDSPCISRSYAYLLTPLVMLLAALLFPIPAFPTEAISVLLPGVQPPGSATVVSSKLTERILRRLQTSESKSTDPWQRDDYRISWITVKWAAYGIPEWNWCRVAGPHAAATYQVLHCLPAEVWPRRMARRSAILGADYSLWYDDAGNLKPESAIHLVKKPVASTRTVTRSGDPRPCDRRVA